MIQTRSPYAPPIGYSVSVRAVKGEKTLRGWFNFRAWKGKKVIQDGAAEGFYSRAEARQAGIQTTWDFFEGKISEKSS